MWKFKSKRVKRLEDYAEALEKENSLFCAELTKSDAEKRALELKVEILTAEKDNLARENVELEGTIAELKTERDALLASIEELKEKRTVSQMTTEEETPPTQAQILDEYLNGVDEE